MFLADTDSLMYNLKLKMFLKNFVKDNLLFNFINYHKKLKYYIGVNNLLVYITKHGTCNRPIKGFVEIKSKICIFITEDNHESKKAKGIKIMLSVIN